MTDSATTSDADRPVVVLSPHLDDAVLSAWSLLTRRGPTTVVTVFAGVPPQGVLTDLDRSHGATDSAEWMLRRRADDRAILGPLGCTVVHLDLPDVQMAAYDMPRVRDMIAAEPAHFLDIVRDEPALRNDAGQLAQLLLEVVPLDAVVYGPAGIGGHPNHCDLAGATILLARDRPSVCLYADSPYYLFLGTPRLIPGRSSPEADSWVGEALASLVPDPTALTPRVVRLDDVSLADKLRAVEGYSTEAPFIAGDIQRLGIAADALRYEIFWGLPDMDEMASREVTGPIG